MPNSQGNLPTSSAAEVTAKDCVTSDRLQFEENVLIAFRCCDGYQFNVMEFIKSFYTKEVTSYMQTVENILTILSITENLATFCRENCWETGSMLLAHVLKTLYNMIYFSLVSVLLCKSPLRKRMEVL